MIQLSAHCYRCNDTGLVLQEYIDPLPLPSLSAPVDPNGTVQIKIRKAHCPECLGFSPAFKFMKCAG